MQGQKWHVYGSGTLSGARNDDRPRRGHRYVPLAGDWGDGLGGGPGRQRAHRARRTEDQDEQWIHSISIRDTQSRFEERAGRSPADSDAIQGRDAFGSRPAPALPIAEHDGVSAVASSPPGATRHIRGATPGTYDERARDPRDPDERRPQRRGLDNDGGTHAPRDGDDGEDGEGDAGDGGPGTRGGGRVANLRPGLGARGGHGASGGPGFQGSHGSQTAPAGSSQSAAEGAQRQAPAGAEAQGDGGGILHEGMDQEAGGSWLVGVGLVERQRMAERLLGQRMVEPGRAGR